MNHAGFRVVASVGIMTLASACGSRQGADGSTTVVERRSASEAAIDREPPPAGASSEAFEGVAEADSLTPASGPADQRAGPESDCPMQMREARLAALPAMSGVAFLFTTRSEAALDELRRRALALHDAYARGLEAAPGVENDPAAKTTIETSVEYLDERDGARVEIRAIHQNDVDELRRRLRSDTTAMSDQRRCPALGDTEAAVQGASNR